MADTDTKAMTGTDEPQTGWAQRPILAAVLRLLVFLVPVIASIALISLVTRIVPRPADTVTMVIWFAGLTVTASTTVAVGDRIMRRFLPVVALFRLSLVFPDRAPARFAMAMRRNTVRGLQRDLAAGTLGHRTPQDAAEHLLLLAGALNDHDRLTRGHTERVRAYALMIGEEMGLPEDDLARLHWAGLIHDVGKLEIPAELLSKSEALSNEDWEMLRSHPAMGAHLVAPLRDWLGPWALAAAEHHERWDGTGYPAGLAEEEISLAGRIVAVADAFDVITSARSYKVPRAPEHARQELARNSGSQFDPDVVRAFLNIGIGRLRLVMGPLSWLTQLPVMGQTPLAPALGAAATTGLAMVGATALGVLGPPVADTPTEAPGTGVAYIATEEPADHAARSADVVVDEPSFESGTLTLTVLEDNPVTIDLVEVLGREVDDVEVLTHPVAGELIGAPGALTFVPGPDVTGLANAVIDVCSASGCTTVDVVITIVADNDPPIATDDRAATSEDVAIVVDVLANDTDVEDSPLRIVTVERVGGWKSDRAAITPDGVRYHPAPDTSGTVVLDYVVVDVDGGRASGRATIDIVPVNDPPTFEPGPAVTVTEDSGASTTQWADAISPGPDDEEHQTLTFVMTPDDPSLFSAAPTIDADGRLRFTPAPDANGSTDIGVVLVDDGGTSGGGRNTTPPTTLTITISSGNDPPFATDDSYSSSMGVTLSVPAPGVLVNDGDVDGTTPRAVTTLASGPEHGIVDLADDGSFTYTPTGGFHGTDQFVYRVVDEGGLPATAAVRVTVVVGAATSRTWYLQNAGSAADDYALALTPPPASDPVTDSDRDGDPGLTLKQTDKGLAENDPDKLQRWSLPVNGTPLVLDGPVSLDLWSTDKDFHADHEGHAYVWLLDCDGASCTTLASTDVFDAEWNGGSADWVHRSIALGSVSHEVVPGHQLRLRLQFDEHEAWVAMTADRPSALHLTTR